MNFETIASVREIKAYNLEAIQVKAQILKGFNGFCGLCWCRFCKFCFMFKLGLNFSHKNRLVDFILT